MLPSFSYKRPATLKQAIEAAGRSGSRIHAGGTDLVGSLRDGIVEAQQVVSLSGIGELKGIARAADGGLRIGALATLAEVAGNDLVRQSHPVLAQAALSAASPQLRNQGTLGGNLCQRPRCWYFRGDFPCLRKGGDACYAEAGENDYHCIFGGDRCYMVHPSDTAPALVALEAQVRIAGAKGVKSVPLASFFLLPKDSVLKENILEPGEILTDVLIPAPAAGTRGVYRKVRERGSWDFATAGAAVVLQSAEGKVRKARIVLSGAAPVPWRAMAAEKALEGRALDASAASAAAAAAVEGAKPLDQNAYKVPLFRGLLEEVLLGLV